MDDPTSHYMEATDRMRQRAEQAEHQRDMLRDDMASIAFAVVDSDAVGTIDQSEIVDLVRAVVVERDRLRAVIDDVDGPVAKTMEYLAQVEAERDLLRSALLDIITVADPSSTVAVLAQGALDGVPSELDEVEAGMTAEKAHDYYADPANRQPVGPPVRRMGAVERERQRIWTAINAWEEQVGQPFSPETVPFKPLAPFFDELRAMVFNVEATGERDRTDYRDIWPFINQLADDVEGVDGNVIRGWLDTTVREAIFGTDGSDTTRLDPGVSPLPDDPGVPPPGGMTLGEDPLGYDPRSDPPGTDPPVLDSSGGAPVQ